MIRILLIILLALFTLSSCATRVVHRSPATKTVVITQTPKKYRVVRVKGKKYYFWNGKYHRKTRKGYVVVTI